MNKLGIRSLSDAFKFLKLNIWLCLVLILSVEVFKEVVKNPPFLFFFLFLFATKVATSKIIPTTAAIISQITAALTTAILILFPIVGETLGPRFNQGAGTRGTTGQGKTSEREQYLLRDPQTVCFLSTPSHSPLHPTPARVLGDDRWSEGKWKVCGRWIIIGYNLVPGVSLPSPERVMKRGHGKEVEWGC